MSKIKEAKNSKAGTGKSAQGKTICAEPERAPRLPPRGPLRGRPGAAGLGAQVHPRRPHRTSATSYALVKNGEIFLFGAQITPLIQASTHVIADDRRTRKLLMHRHEIDKLVGKVERDGYTLIPTAMYWKGNKVKLELALAKGKQDHDKRAGQQGPRLAAREAAHDAPHNKNA